MVQGQTRSATRPNLYYDGQMAPSSHGVRRNMPDTRGKGWQRSKSNMRDYRSNSDICFNEEQSMQRRGYVNKGRSQNEYSDSTFNRRGTSQRRLSVDTHRKSGRSCPDQNCTKVPTVPMQKRVATCPPPKYVQHCVTGDDEFVGFTTIKDSKYLPKETGMREGPKPKKYIQKLSTLHVSHDFPKVNEEDEERFKCDKRKLEMLVKTGDFVEYGYCDDPIRWETHLTNDTKHLRHYGLFEPEHDDSLFHILEEVRLEFPENELNADNEIVGRIYLKVNRECRVDFLKVDINQIYTVFKEGGRNVDSTKATKITILPADKTEAAQEDYDILEKLNHKILLPPGAHAIPFTLKVSKKRPPTLVQVRADNGDMVLNCYTIAALFKIDNNVRETERVTFVIPLPSGVKKEQIRFSDNNVVTLGSSGREIRDGNFL